MSYNGSTGITCPAGSTFTGSNMSSGSGPLATEITKLTLPTISIGKIDVTNMASTFPYKEERPDWGTPGDAEADCNLTAADFKAIKAKRGVTQTFTIVIAQGNGSTAAAITCSFPGYIDDVSGDVPAEGKASMKVKVHMVGEDTYT